MSMTAQVLASELSSLVQESKRKNPEIRTVRLENNMFQVFPADGSQAAEKSLNDLKSLPQTSEAQLSAGLDQKCAWE